MNLLIKVCKNKKARSNKWTGLWWIKNLPGAKIISLKNLCVIYDRWYSNRMSRKRNKNQWWLHTLLHWHNVCTHKCRLKFFSYQAYTSETLALAFYRMGTHFELMPWCNLWLESSLLYWLFWLNFSCSWCSLLSVKCWWGEGVIFLKICLTKELLQ